MTTITARRQIRLAALDALQTIAGVDWASPGEWDVPPTKFPAGRLRVATDTKTAVAKAAPIFDTTVVLELQLYVTGTTDALTQDALEGLAAQVEGLIFGWTPLRSLVSRFANAQSQVAISTEGARPVGIISTSIACETVETFDPVETPIDLRELGIHVDFQTVAVDLTGTYPGTDFPEAVTPAPRTAGPDGRDEARLEYDMTVSPGAPSLVYPARPRVVGTDVVFPDGSLLSKKRGWSLGREGFARQQDIIDAKNQGASIIRIPIRWYGPYDPTQGSTDARSDGSPGGLDPQQLALAKARVQWCVDAGLPFVLFIDTNCGQNGLQDAATIAYCASVGPYVNIGHNLFTDPALRAQYWAVWCYVAKLFARTPGFSLLEITPELNWAAAGATDADYVAYYQAAAAILRSCAPGVPFLVGAESYGISNCKAAFNKFERDFVYTGNLYLHTNTPDPVADMVTRMGKLTGMRDSKGVPVWLQQFGVRSGDELPGNVYLSTLLNLALTNNVGGAVWTQRDGPFADGYGVTWTDAQGVDHVKSDELALISAWFQAA